MTLPAGPSGRHPPERLPTLTEVIELSQTRLPPAGYGAEPLAPEVERRHTVSPVVQDRRIAPLPPAHRSPQENEQIVRRVMEELQRQIDLMLEYRLREAIAPVLTRVADNLVREIRAELASTLRDVVARAVDQEIARHRDPQSDR